MRAPTITIDGTTLNGTFSISDLSRTWPGSEVETARVPGRAGSVVTSRSIGSRQVSFRLWAASRDHAVMMNQFANLMDLLHGSDKHRMTIGDEDERVRTVVLEGDLSYEEYERNGSVLLTFLQPDPFCDGAAIDVAVPSGGSASFSTSHAGMAHVRLDSTAAVRSSSTREWGVTIDGSKLHVVLDTPLASTVSIDCETREVLVNGERSMITLDSDWPEIRGGDHVVRMDAGTGAATLGLRERRL